MYPFNKYEDMGISRSRDRTGLIVLLDLFLVGFLNFYVCPDVWWTKLATCQLSTTC